MVRRCISLLVVAGILAGQLATIPHAHARLSAAEQKRHDATPHFHSHRARHAHHGHGHQHRHAPKVPRRELQQRPLQVAGDSTDSPVEADGHESSAFFVPVSAPSTAQKGLGAFANPKASSTPATGILLVASQLKLASPPWHPPDEVLDGSNLYLTLRTLRN